MPSIGQPEQRSADCDNERPDLFSGKGLPLPGSDRRQREIESASVQEIDQQGADRKQDAVGNNHQNEPSSPGDSTDQRSREDRRDPPRQQHGGGEPVDGIERQHDRLGERGPPGHAAEIQRLLIHEDEDAGAGRRRGKQKRQQREGEQHLKVQGARSSPALPEKEKRHPLGQTALQHRQADGQHTDQKIGHRFGKAHQGFREPRNASGKDERNHQQNPGDGRRDRVGAPEADGHHRHGQDPLPRHGKTGRRRQEHQGYRQPHHENGDPKRSPLSFRGFDCPLPR